MSENGYSTEKLLHNIISDLSDIYNAHAKKCVRNERNYIKSKKNSIRVTNLTLRRVHRNVYPS